MGWKNLLLMGFCIGIASAGLAADEAPARQAKPPAPRPLIGAIRWDAWYAGNAWEPLLAPEQYHDRLPFYGKIDLRK